jgi:hypothetical protein
MMANMQDFGFISSSTGIDNEVEILKSHILATEAVKDLKLYTEYRAEGRIKKQLIYNTQPINVDIDAEGLKNLDEARKSIVLKIEVSGKKYIIKGGSKEKPISATLDKLPATLDTEYGKLTFTKNDERGSFNGITNDSPERKCQAGYFFSWTFFPHHLRSPPPPNPPTHT